MKTIPKACETIVKANLFCDRFHQKKKQTHKQTKKMMSLVNKKN